ncbi:LuxR family transcriptional regulator [Novosphingobium sp. JCM 18896]|uniref:LuxR family transcriptional regulator n=1 Tax=Novosphingobium sp. JCM 18896 TaxID=2989731 RepID=UPI002222FA98|nr:LuxR family transcriptional regulator [Novosphingobium sp. JCM 18896]MCW1430892.1 LuxR family transcriptional regulator [Novosphingobium sp. JCM 18896]
MEMLKMALAWADRLAEARSTEVLRDIMAEAGEWLGARYFALSQHADFSRRPRALRLHNYPDGWETYYDARSLGLCDPIHRASQRRGRGFHWREVPQIIRLDRADRHMLLLGRQIGLGEGLTVPFHIPGEARGSCSFVAEIGNDLAYGALIWAEAIGAAAFERLRLLHRDPDRDRLPRLSPRQLQCAALAARGYTNPQIARYLGISVQTVMDHLREAFKRLEVESRMELAMVLLEAGDLCFDDVPPRCAA